MADPMGNNSEKIETKKIDRPYGGSLNGDGVDFSTTSQIKRETFTGKIPVARRAYFEVVSYDDKNESIELGESEVIVGRSPKSDIQLSVDNVSRRHARVLFRNEEYHIEDLNSTNGLYVNGVRVEKCVLRNNDQIEVGGVKILFLEEMALKKNDTTE